MTTYANKTGEALVCSNCGEDIDDGDHFKIEDDERVCELCHEDRHEYDND